MKTKTKGQALTEFALILPLLLLLILGVIEAGRIIWAYVQVQNAAREATRYAVTGQPYDADGNPWTRSDTERATAIKNVAVGYATGLGVTAVATRTEVYTAYASTPGAFGVLVKGQRNANDAEGEADYPGKPGLNVLVQVYFNVQLLDPIYSAIFPWVRINGQVLMQNEGIDTTASGLAPVGLVAPPPGTGGGGAPPGSGRVPKISIAEAQPVPAGTTITILLEDHSPSTTYAVYFDDVLIGTVTTNAQFFASLTYYIPIDKTGEHTIHSELPGTGSGGADTTIHVAQSTSPALIVDGGNRWPSGSPITIRIFSHDPNTQYRIYLAGNLIGTITTDASGNGTLLPLPSYTIPTAQPEGSVYIESRTMSGTSIAGTTITIISPDVVIQGGTVWPPGTRIFIILRDHAPNQTYSVYFRDNLVTPAITTNAIGEAILSYIIPGNTADGTYAVTSRQGAAIIAQINVQVATPPTPYIVIPGGYEWPAGSPITIQLRKHSANLDYHVYFGANYVGRFGVDAFGEYSIAYVIPVTQTTGVVSLRSVRTDNGDQEASVNVTVTAVPVVNVDGGLLQPPGANITIRLTNHAANAAYDVYLDGVKIGTVTTNGSGAASLAYTIPVGTTPGPYTLESRPKDETTVIASAILTVRAPDLTVVSIQTPASPIFNTPMPITITIRNNSDKAISNQYFDVDLYIDPTLAPIASDAGLPPGSKKYWYNSIPASGTLTINDTITLWGPTDHNLYARVDTSGNILESSETNNILGKVVSPASCGLEIADEFEGSGMPAGWASVFYGNALNPSTYNQTAPQVDQTGGTLYVMSEGRSTTQADDDNGSNAGYAFVYREGSGDFDVYVQVVSNAYSYYTERSSGLEVRDDLNGTAAKVNLLLISANTVRLGTRSTPNVYSYNPATTNPDYPIWLRLVRRGNTFSAYVAPRTVTNVPPQANDWVFLRDVQVAMDGTVYVGLVNATQNWSNTRSRNWSSSNFDHFHYCGDPAGARACGQVNEAGGLVVLDARNYTDNIIRNSQAWTTTTRAGLLGMVVPSAGVAYYDPPYATTSPELQYQVKFSTAGRYYIDLLAWGPDASGDSVHMGLGGSELTSATDINGFTTSSTGPPAWYPGNSTSFYIDIPAAGSYVVNLWMREDGAQVYKIALSTDPNYPLTGFGPDQSACTVTAPQDLPPGYRRCNQALTNGDFEGGYVQDVTPYWVIPEAEQVARTNVHYISPGTSFGVLLPSSIVGGVPRQPYLYQQFAMPSWVLTSTTAVLNLQKAVDWLATPQNEPLYFYLRSSSGVTLTTPITVVTGQDLPDLDPLNYDNTRWRPVSVDVIPAMLAAGYNPTNFANQNLQAYFFSPNPAGTNSSEFYVDKITLDICTMQPLPSPINTSLGGTTMVNQALKSGVNVWAYQTNGPVYTTYSIQDGTYHFYNLPAGTYLIYAEYWLSGTRYWTQTYAAIPPNTVTKNLVLSP